MVRAGLTRSFLLDHARFQTIEGFLTPVVTGRARVADLSVVPSIGEKDDEFWAGMRDAVLFQSGRPVLIVPDGASSAFGETVVVAWKDGWRRSVP